MKESEIKIWKDKIDGMDQIQLARLLRFGPVGHPVFDKTLPLCTYFDKRFKELGGMTPSISKSIGWDP